MAMSITNQADYALRSLLYLAPLDNKIPVPSSVIAEEMQISRIFLSRINSQLSAAKLIKTKRGARGGICLARKPEEISIHDVLTAVSGPIHLIQCTKEPQNCSLSENCMLIQFWKQVEILLIDRLKQTSLKTLLEEHQRV